MTENGKPGRGSRADERKVNVVLVDGHALALYAGSIKGELEAYKKSNPIPGADVVAVELGEEIPGAKSRLPKSRREVPASEVEAEPAEVTA